MVLNNLPYGFTHEKTKKKVPVQKNSDTKEEYKLPVGGEVGVGWPLDNLSILKQTSNFLPNHRLELRIYVFSNII